VEEMEIVFLSISAFEVIKEVFPNFLEIRKVLYKIDRELKVEIFNPIIKVLFLDNSDLI